MSKKKDILKTVKKMLRRIQRLEYFYRFRKSCYKIDKEFLEEVSKASNISYRKLKWNYIYTSYLYRCTLLEYSEFQLYNFNHRYKKRFFFELRSGNLNYEKYNGKATSEDMNAFIDKSMFNERFKKYITRKSLYCKDKTEDEVSEFIDSMDEIVIKPIREYGGRGIKIIKKEEINDKDDFIKKLIDEDFLVEECLKQCKAMEELNPTSINTVRPFLIRTKKGKVKVISCIVRVGKKGERIDNVSNGGVMYPVDIENGKIKGYGIDHFGHKYMYSSTGKFLIGYQIPKWNEIIQTINDAMEVVKNIGWVSFDICVKEDGVELIEGNVCPGSATFQLDGPKLEILKRYWNEE